MKKVMYVAVAGVEKETGFLAYQKTFHVFGSLPSSRGFHGFTAAWGGSAASTCTGEMMYVVIAGV